MIKYMRKFFVTVIFLFSIFISNAQIILSNDTTVCGNFTDTLYALSSNWSTITADDGHGPVVNLGFSFDFYGQTYTQCVISGNGYITFDISQANQYSPFSINTPIPNPGSLPENAIMAPWHDLNPSIGGNVTYSSYGIAPNRIFIVTWCAVPMYSCTQLLHTSQVVLYEGSNKIEMYIENKPTCLTFNGGQAIQGLVDQTSTNFDIVIDPVTTLPRNFGAPWTTALEGWEFIPNGPNAYTINQVPYVPIIAGTTTWSDILGNTLGVGSALPVSITSTTTFIASMTGSCTPLSVVDSITVTVPDCYDLNINVTPATCFGNDGSILVGPDTTLALWDCYLLDLFGNTIDSSLNNTVANLTFNNLVPNTYVFEVTTPLGGVTLDTVVLSQLPNLLSLQYDIKETNCLDQAGELMVSIIQQTYPWEITFSDSSGVLQNLNIFNTDSITFSSLTSGYYFINIIDAAGCTIEDSVYIPQMINPIDYESFSTDVNCYGGSDGQIGFFVDKGLAPYTFYIDGVQNLDPPPYDSVFTGLGEGTYVIMAIDSDSCKVTDTVTISAPQFPLQVLSSNSVGVCDNSSTGSATAFGAGGTPTSFSATGSPIYNYEWFDDSWGSLGTSPVINNLSVGNYYLEITDANGCDEFIAISVVAPQLPLSISPQLFAVACKGDNSGSAVVFTGGGFSPYNYQWETLSGDTLGSSNGIVDYDTLSGLTAGSYHLEVTDDNGCTEEITFNIQEPNTSLVIDSIKEVNGNICYGDNEGRAIVYVSGGQPFYSYAWDNFDFNNVADSLLGGWHDVVVTDTWGCSVKDSVFINDSSLIESSLNFGVVSCYNFTDGSLSVSSTGGIGPYTYFWSNGQSGLGLTNINNLSSGSYYLTTRDALGCVVIDSIDIPNPDPLYVTAQELLRVSCNGLSDGQAFAVGTGGTSPYNFSWSGTSQVGDSVNTLSAGVDTVTIVDDRGCTAIDTVVINEPDPLLVITTNLVPAYCVGVNTASATASVSGGTLPYSYHWDDNPLAPQITSTAINLYAGVYTATVTDDRGCQNIAIADLSSVTSNMSLQIDPLVGTSTSISCYGANDASLIVSIASSSSSVGPYVYQWIGPSFTSSDSIATNLSAGLYSVTVTDINGCVVNASQQITEPSELRYNVLSTNSSSCLGACDGTISLDIVGGTAPYVGLVTDNTSGITLPPINISSSFDVLDLCTSSYTVHLKDANDCLGSLIGGGTDQAILSSAIPTTVAQIDPIVQSILCNGDSTGQLTVVNPQSSPYSYSWHDLNTGAVTLGDSLMNLPVGTYVLSALYTDSFPSCTTTDTITITQLWPISSTFNILDVDCNGNSTGQIHTLTSGGTAPYNYSWSHNSVINNDTITNLLAGTYTLTITDANLCQDEEVYIVGQPLPLQLNIDSTQTYILNPFTTGGVSPYGYIWMKDNSPLADIEVGVGNSYTVGSYGSYYAIVTDANGCTNTSNIITYTEPVVPGIANLQDFDINIYPNPFKEETTIDFGRVVDEVEIKLFDVLGKLLNDYYLQNIDKFVLFREEKVNGIYFIEVEIKGEKESIYKLVIED